MSLGKNQDLRKCRLLSFSGSMSKAKSVGAMPGALHCRTDIL